MDEIDIENLKLKLICDIIKNNTSNKEFLDLLSQKTSYKTALALTITLVENMPKTTVYISEKGLNQANKYVKTCKLDKKMAGCAKIIYNISKLIKIKDVKKIIKVMNTFVNARIYIQRSDSIKDIIRCVNVCLKIDEICKEFEKEKNVKQSLLKRDTQIKLVGEKKRKRIFANGNERTRRAMDSLSSKKISDLNEYKSKLLKLCKNYNIKLNKEDFFIDYDKLKNICGIKKHY